MEKGSDPQKIQKQKHKGLKRARSAEPSGDGGGDNKPTLSFGSGAVTNGEGKRGVSPAPFGGKFKKKKEERGKVKKSKEKKGSKAGGEAGTAAPPQKRVKNTAKYDKKERALMKLKGKGQEEGRGAGEVSRGRTDNKYESSSKEHTSGAFRGRSNSSRGRQGKPINKNDHSRLVDERKREHPHADVIAHVIKTWNELRERRTAPQKKILLVAEIYGKMKGRVAELALRHDTSRAVQGCIKFGDPKQREAICKELFGHCLEFSKAKHGHQLVEKMLLYGTTPVRMQVAKEFKGHVARLMTHNLGALVFNAGYTKAWNQAVCWDLFQELYGPEYVHFKAELGSDDKSSKSLQTGKGLGALLAARPDKRKTVLDSLFFALSRQCDKGLLSLPVAQKLLCEYLQHAPAEQIVGMVALVKEQLLAFVASREGARAAVLCFQLGTAKERKAILKSLKGHFLDMSCHVYGHLVVVAALESTDDTKTSGSAVFSEISSHLPYLACHRHGKRVLLALLAPKSSRYFSAYDLEVLTAPLLPTYIVRRKDAASGSAVGGKGGEEEEEGASSSKKGKKGVALGAEEEAIEAAAVAAATSAAFIPRSLPAPPSADLLNDKEAMELIKTSKKDDTIRRLELLSQIRDALVSMCLSHTAVLARSKHGSLVLFEVCCVLPTISSPKSGVSSIEATKSILAALANLVANEPSTEEIEALVKEMNSNAALASAGSKNTSSQLLVPSGPKIASEVVAKSGDVEMSAIGEDNDGIIIDRAGDFSTQDPDDEDVVMDGNEEDDDDDGQVVPIPARDGEKSGGARDDDQDDDLEGEDLLLPLLEHSPSHLLFKRLLQLEAVPRNRENSLPKGVTPVANPTKDGPVVFGPLLLKNIQENKIRISTLVTSNRAAFVAVEFLNSRDKATSKAVMIELKEDKAQLEKGEDSPGLKLLLSKINA
jgi:pumilio homology domain family member 6